MLLLDILREHLFSGYMLDIEGEKVAEDQVCQGWIGHLMGWKVYKDEDDWSRY